MSAFDRAYAEVAVVEAEAEQAHLEEAGAEGEAMAEIDETVEQFLDAMEYGDLSEDDIPTDERYIGLMKEKARACPAYDDYTLECASEVVARLQDDLKSGHDEAINCPRDLVICCAFCAAVLECCDTCPDITIYVDDLME